MISIKRVSESLRGRGGFLAGGLLCCLGPDRLEKPSRATRDSEYIPQANSKQISDATWRCVSYARKPASNGRDAGQASPTTTEGFKVYPQQNPPEVRPPDRFDDPDTLVKMSGANEHEIRS